MECFSFPRRCRACPRRNADLFRDLLFGYVLDPLVLCCCLHLQRLAVGLTVKHRPVAILKEPYLKSGRFVADKALSDDMFPTWKKLEELVDKGKIKNIGVSKYVLQDTFVCPRLPTLTTFLPLAVSLFGGSNNL